MKRRKTVSKYDNNYLTTKEAIKELNPKPVLTSLLGIGLVAGSMANYIGEIDSDEFDEGEDEERGDELESED